MKLFMEKIEETETFDDKKFQRDIFPHGLKSFSPILVLSCTLFFSIKFFWRKFSKKLERPENFDKKKILLLKSKKNCNKNFCI